MKTTKAQFAALQTRWNEAEHAGYKTIKGKRYEVRKLGSTTIYKKV